MSVLTLYSELLFNIRHVTVFATLTSKKTDETTAQLSPDRTFFSLCHEGKSVSIKLPCEVLGNTNLTVPTSKDNILLFRLQISDRIKLGERSVNFESPFDVDSLSSITEIACNGCKSIITKGRIGTWRELPRENWAETMDFWYCHRPNENKVQSGPVARQGYEAVNHLLARRGYGFVDTCHLVISIKDCSCVEVLLGEDSSNLDSISDADSKVRLLFYSLFRCIRWHSIALKTEAINKGGKKETCSCIQIFSTHSNVADTYAQDRTALYAS